MGGGGFYGTKHGTSPRNFYGIPLTAGWSSPLARQARNLKVFGSNPATATNLKTLINLRFFGFLLIFKLFSRVSVSAAKMQRMTSNHHQHITNKVCLTNCLDGWPIK